MKLVTISKSRWSKSENSNLDPFLDVDPLFVVVVVVGSGGGASVVVGVIVGVACWRFVVILPIKELT